jgi:hypothetical protein
VVLSIATVFFLQCSYYNFIPTTCFGGGIYTSQFLGAIYANTGSVVVFKLPTVYILVFILAIFLALYVCMWV